MPRTPRAPDPRILLRALFDAAIGAADPARCLPPHLPAPAPGQTIVVGAGKAAAAMARAVEESWPEDALPRLSGVVVTRYGHAVPCRRIRVVEAAHPLPDEAATAGARAVLEAVRGLGSDDMVLCLVSGGASALLALPAPGLSLADKRAVCRALLDGGAGIGDLNCVRRHLSAIKGGRLALAAAPARVVTLLISDVPGDDPAIVGSGPTVADRTTGADALAVLDRHAVAVPPAIRAHLAGPAAGAPDPDDPRLATVDLRMAARPADALDAAAALARAEGLPVEMLGDAIEGPAREVATGHARLALAASAPCLLLSGGECTVRVTGDGSGGPNTEYALALAMALDGAPGIAALAADTDGRDGRGEQAGAYVLPDTLARAGAARLDPATALADNDSAGFFAALDDLLITGPTLTNVNDFRAILVRPGAAGKRMRQPA